MSAQANLAGLFPPTNEEMWHNNIPWQPIPVHTVPRQLDTVLSASKDCPKYKVARQNYLNASPEVHRIYTEYADIFPYLTKMSGANVTTITDAYWLHNTLAIERDHNKSLVFF